MHRMNDFAWKKATVRAAKLWPEENFRPALPGYLSIRIHDLGHLRSSRASRRKIERHCLGKRTAASPALNRALNQGI
ncbi:integrase [Pseudomonas amygdali pv. aesculi]|nr:integrase family protein [Pseudomonas amygdali pv. aesculi str. 0893_23]KWS29249.1 integrase [Pseudomonas amygdali pv. ulmi]KWS85587.1 integrase [Pseudomonas amygdali pv. dendropanacis]KWT10704.1 integrase [Pseudomonas amygdali pv. aesculi]KWT15429.1 integrase [Pseudomonas amygdali pv. aesculi]